jgi:hypothetical protein
MKTLLRLLLVVIVMGLTNPGFTQNFGIKAGLNLSNMLVKDDDERYSDDLNILPGFQVGATVEFPIKDMFGIETGILVSTKGFKYDEDELGYAGGTTLYYIDIPINGKAYFDVGDVKIYGAFGPYIGIGIYGQTKAKYSYGGDTQTEKQDIKWGKDDDEDDLRRIDMGLSFGAGVEVSSFVFGIAYELGLANISSYISDGAKMKNRSFGITVGLKFGEK